MPTVTVRALPLPEPVVSAAQVALARQLSDALGCAPERVWCQWLDVRSAHVGVGERGPQDQCIVATIRARAGRDDAVVAAGLEATARALSLGTGLPVEDIWVHWVDLPPGRVFAGGALR